MAKLRQPKTTRSAPKTRKGGSKSPTKQLIKQLNKLSVSKQSTRKKTASKKVKKPAKETALKKSVTPSSTNSVKINNDISKQVLLTRNGRIKKKSQLRLQVLNEILKHELLISEHAETKMTNQVVCDKKKSVKVNNNDSGVSDQNIEIEIELELDVDSSKVTGKSQNVIVNNVTVSNDTLLENVKEKQIITKPKNKKKNKTKNSAENHINSDENQTMDKELRNDVLGSMKNALGDDDTLPEIDSNKDAKKKSKPKKLRNVQDTKSDEDSTDTEETAQKSKPKGKQVTLSNGLVLTLSMLNCDHCHKTFCSKSSLNRHKLIHEDVRNNVCNHCEKRFTYKSTLKKHMQSKHPDIKEKTELHVCGTCDRTFLMKENLELHLTSHLKSETKFACIYCGKKFSYKLLMVQHEKTHHSAENNVYTCFLCNMIFENRNRLSKHLKIHTKTKEYICHLCGKGFLRINSIKRHVMVCHSGQRIQCPVCFKELKGHLSEHLRVHEDIRPHKCVDCGMAFKQSTQLTVHRRAHSGVRPYLCRICNRAFGHSNALKQHILKHTKEKPYKCAMCPLAFSQLPHMKTHMNKIHHREAAYKCNNCQQFFKLKAQLEDHMKLCNIVEKEMSFEEKIQASVQYEEIEVESVMDISRMRYLLALLFTLITSKRRLVYLGFNKRLIDDILSESLEAMGFTPTTDSTISPFKRLKSNIEMMLEATVPKAQMAKFRGENKTTEDILLLLTDEKKDKD